MKKIKEIDKAYGRLILCPGYQLLRLYDDEDLLVLPSSMQGKSEVMKKLKSWSESQKNPLHSWWPRLAREKKIPLLTVSLMSGVNSKYLDTDTVDIGFRHSARSSPIQI